jgi:hypothetical protein
VVPLALRSAPEQFGHRPIFAPETAEQSVSIRGERDKRLILWDLSGERSLHTGEVVGSIPTAPTIFQALLGSIRQLPAERYGNTRCASVQNRCNPFTERSHVFPGALAESLTLHQAPSGCNRTSLGTVENTMRMQWSAALNGL